MNDAQEFYYDREAEVFYLANFQEELYIKIDKDSPFYELCRHLYCANWATVSDRLPLQFKEVFKISQIDGGD